MASPSEAATPRESVCSKARPPMTPSVISATCSLSTWTAGSARTMKKPISIASGTSTQLCGKRGQSAAQRVAHGQKAHVDRREEQAQPRRAYRRCPRPCASACARAASARRSGKWQIRQQNGQQAPPSLRAGNGGRACKSVGSTSPHAASSAGVSARVLAGGQGQRTSPAPAPPISGRWNTAPPGQSCPPRRSARRAPPPRPRPARG